MMSPRCTPERAAGESRSTFRTTTPSALRASKCWASSSVSGATDIPSHAACPVSASPPPPRSGAPPAAASRGLGRLRARLLLERHGQRQRFPPPIHLEIDDVADLALLH